MASEDIQDLPEAIRLERCIEVLERLDRLATLTQEDMDRVTSSYGLKTFQVRRAEPKEDDYEIVTGKRSRGQFDDDLS